MFPKENKVREHIPVPYDYLFQSILNSASRCVKVIFSLGPMIARAMTNGHKVVSIEIRNWKFSRLRENKTSLFWTTALLALLKSFSKCSEVKIDQGLLMFLKTSDRMEYKNLK